jgi:hypothetical protein
LVEKSGKGYRSNASAKGNTGKLCNPIVDGEHPFFIGNYQREESKK